MGKITKKLIRYFVIIISVVIILSSILSSIFLSKLYMDMQYNELKDAGISIYNTLKEDGDISALDLPVSSAVLIKDGSIIPLTQRKMGMMPFIRSMNPDVLGEKGKYKNNMMGQEFLYYRHDTDIGDIVVLQDNKYSADFLNLLYVVLGLVLFLSIAISVPVISHVGKKFTKPVLDLQKASGELSKGSYDMEFSVHTGDELEELSISLQHMKDSLKKKDSLQRDFIANVSHDFKTPLSITRNLSEAISDGIVDEEGIREYSEDIIKEVDRLNMLVTDLLELSKYQGGKYTINRTPLNLKEFLVDAVSAFKTAAQKRGIKISVEGVEALICADPKYLYRVVYNFIDNAVKFSPDGGTIEVIAAAFDNEIKVSVKDQGKGIDEKAIDSIWERYHKDKESGGMGLGLAICREILKLHGFQYGVRSKPDEGAEFYFAVPEKYIKQHVIM